MKRKEIKLTIDELVEMVETRVTNVKRSESLMKRGIASGQLILDEKSLLNYVNVDFATGEITYIPMEEFMKASQQVQEVTKAVDGRTSQEKRDAGDMAIDLTEKPEVRLRGSENVVEALEVIHRAMTTDTLRVMDHATNILKNGGAFTQVQLTNRICVIQEALLTVVQKTVWNTLVMEDGSEVRRASQPNVVKYSDSFSKGFLPLSTDGMMNADSDYLVCVEIKPDSVMSAKYGWNYVVLRIVSEYVDHRMKTVKIPTRAGSGEWEGREFVAFEKMDCGHVSAVHKGFAYLSDAKAFMKDMADKVLVLRQFTKDQLKVELTAEEREARLHEEQDKELAKAGKPALPDY